MDSQRVKQIIESPVTINVSYHGIPVYIEEIDVGNQTVAIFPLGNMEARQEVDLAGLIEEGP